MKILNANTGALSLQCDPVPPEFLDYFTGWISQILGVGPIVLNILPEMAHLTGEFIAEDDAMVGTISMPTTAYARGEPSQTPQAPTFTFIAVAGPLKAVKAFAGLQAAGAPLHQMPEPPFMAYFWHPHSNLLQPQDIANISDLTYNVAMAWVAQSLSS